MKETIHIIEAGALRDACGVEFRPGALAVGSGKILSAGPLDDIHRQFATDENNPAKDLETHFEIHRDWSKFLILPAMVNAHAHLDLSDLGPAPFAGRFIDWIQDVIARRPQGDDQIKAAVLAGLRMSGQGGVGQIGDIAGSEAALRARLHADPTCFIEGGSWLECFGFGQRGIDAGQAALQLVEDFQKLETSLRHQQPDRGMLLIGLQPHAPYSAGMDLYSQTHDASCPFSTHLAETLGEDQFIRDASGPLAEFLKTLDRWDDVIEPNDCSPVEYLSFQLEKGLWTVAHCNYVSDQDIEILAQTDASVAYCPVASEYFGHTDHRYRDMLEAGVNVCLGTDSIICQPTDESQPLGILPQMRLLYRRDKTEPGLLLEMATLNGAKALCFDKTIIIKDRKAKINDSHCATLQTGAPAKLIAVEFDPGDSTDALTQVLTNKHPVKALDFEGRSVSRLEIKEKQ